MYKPTLSTLILTHNNAGKIELLLKSASKNSDEVIIVDNDSTDDIKELAQKYEAKFFSRELNNDFAAQRNFALQKSTSDWSIFIDSDEMVPDDLWREIRSTINGGDADALFIRRLDSFLGKQLQHGEVGNIRLLRCARTNIGRGKWSRKVHETWLLPTAKTLELKTPLEHHPHPTLSEFLTKLHWYASLEPASRGAYSFPQILLEIFLFPGAKFLQNYIVRFGFLDGWQGFIHAILMSYYSLIARVFLYEKYFTQKT